MKFVWNMTEENWRNLKHDHAKENGENLSKDYDFYGNCCVGNLCAEILHTGDNSDSTTWFSYTNIYALGIDDGYNETTKGKIPYALLDDGFKIPVECNSFSNFKREFENRFENLIKDVERVRVLADAPLGDWR